MCPPEHYGIDYEINPWMDRQRGCDRRLAVEQWHALRQVLEQVGARISCLTPVAGLPDMVFTANAALVYKDRAILSRFRHPERQGEEPHNERWLGTHGFQVHRLPADLYFEGAGDALFCGDTLFAGYRIRSAARGHQQVGAMLGCRVIPLELVDPYCYHLDVLLSFGCPNGDLLSPGRSTSIAAASSTIDRRPDRRGRGGSPALRLQRRGGGRTVITNTGCPSCAATQTRGFTTHETPLGSSSKPAAA